MYRLKNSLNDLGKQIILSAPILPVRRNEITFDTLQHPLKVRFSSDRSDCEYFKEEGSLGKIHCDHLPVLSSDSMMVKIDITRTLTTSGKNP